jgi:hypothetical protein
MSTMLAEGSARLPIAAGWPAPNKAAALRVVAG